MTPTQTAAYLALAGTKDYDSFMAALLNLEGTIGPETGALDDQKLLMAFCGSIRLLAQIANGTQDNAQAEARRLLGWPALS